MSEYRYLDYDKVVEGIQAIDDVETDNKAYKMYQKARQDYETALKECANGKASRHWITILKRKECEALKTYLASRIK